MNTKCLHIFVEPKASQSLIFMADLINVCKYVCLSTKNVGDPLDCRHFMSCFFLYKFLIRLMKIFS